MATNEIVVTQEDGPITDAHADFVRALIAFARHRIAAEQRGYERARKQAAGVLDEWISNTGELLLACGEMTAQEILTVKAVLRQRNAAIRSMKDKRNDR